MRRPSLQAKRKWGFYKLGDWKSSKTVEGIDQCMLPQNFKTRSEKKHLSFTKKANDLHVGINLTKTKRNVLHFYYETKLLSCPVVSVETSGFQPLNLIRIKNVNLLYYMLDYFTSFFSVLHFTVVSRRLFLLVGRLSGNDDGKRQRQQQKRPESHIRFSLAKKKLCTCITGHFFCTFSCRRCTPA